MENKNCLDCACVLRKDHLSKDQWKTSRCIPCYRTYQKNRRVVYRAGKATQARDCPICNKNHISPGYCGSYCSDCFRIRETRRKEDWRKRNPEINRANLKRYKTSLKGQRFLKEWKKASARKKKEILVSETGGKCQICGYNKNLAALSFHHIDPTTKESKNFEIARMLRHHRTLEALRTEIAKCLLLCENCHREQHYPDLTSPISG